MLSHVRSGVVDRCGESSMDRATCAVERDQAVHRRDGQHDLGRAIVELREVVEVTASPADVPIRRPPDGGAGGVVDEVREVAVQAVEHELLEVARDPFGHGCRQREVVRIAAHERHRRAVRVGEHGVARKEQSAALSAAGPVHDRAAWEVPARLAHGDCHRSS